MNFRCPTNFTFASTNNFFSKKMDTLPPIPIKKHRSFFRRLLVFFLVFIGLILLGLVVTAAFFQKQVTEKILSNLRKTLKTELQVRDHKLSLLSGFPDASLDLKGVRLGGAFGGNLLEAEQLSFRFELFSLFSDNILVKSVVVRDGALVLKTNKNGQQNYEISKDVTPAKTSKPAENNASIALQNADFQNIELIYENKQTNQAIRLEINQADFSGNFSAKKFNLVSHADFVFDFVESDSTRYLAGEKMNYTASFDVDLTQDLYNLQSVEANLGGNVFQVSGIVINKPDFTDFNLKMDSNEGDISMVFNLLPQKFHDYFSDFQSSGMYACSGTVKGRLSKTQTPTTTFGVRLRDGNVTSDKLQSPLRHAKLQAMFTARPDGLANFEITGFEGDFGGSPFRLDLKINNLDDPTVDLKTSGTLPLAAIWGLFDLPEISDGDGFLQIPSLEIHGKYADMISMNRIPFVTATGQMIFQNAELTYNKIPVQFQNGALRLAGNDVFAEKINLRLGESEIFLDAAARNLLPVLLADSLNSEQARLDFTGKMAARKLNVSELIKMFSIADTTKIASPQILDSMKIARTVEHESVTGKLNGIFEAKIDEYIFEKITGKNFSGKIAFDQNVLMLKGETETMGGKIAVEGEHKFDKQPSLQLRCAIQNIDLKTCFEQFDNFDLDFITAENLKGRLDARVAAWAFWNEKGEFLEDKTRALVDLTGKNGELGGVKMFEEFSTYIHLEDLKRVKFTQIQNFFEVSNRRLIIPTMFIQSNAVNMTVSGTHTFDGAIDYKIKVNAGQVLLNKMKKHDSGLDPLPVGGGVFNLFYVVNGTTDKFDYHRSKKTVKAEFERGESQKRGMASRLDYVFETAPKFPEIVSFLERPENNRERE